MSGADKSLGLLGSLVKATDGSLLITLASHCILGILGGKPHREVKLRGDESWEDNVAFIRKICGPDVQITRELPSIHERVALHIGNNQSLLDIDVAMKAGIVSAVQQVRELQAKNDGYISWTRLQQIPVRFGVFPALWPKNKRNNKTKVEDPYFRSSSRVVSCRVVSLRRVVWKNRQKQTKEKNKKTTTGKQLRIEQEKRTTNKSSSGSQKLQQLTKKAIQRLVNRSHIEKTITELEETTDLHRSVQICTLASSYLLYLLYVSPEWK